MNIYKKCMLDQNLEGVAQKMRLPRPSEVQNWKGCGRLNFWATAQKFCTSSYFLKIFKWYLYNIFIFPLVSDFEKMQKSDMSRLQWSLTRVVKFLKNAGLILTSKFEGFWGFILKKPQSFLPKKPQNFHPQPQKCWPHPHLSFWGVLRVNLK